MKSWPGQTVGSELSGIKMESVNPLHWSEAEFDNYETYTVKKYSTVDACFFMKSQVLWK